MQPGTYDITVHQGATFKLIIQLKDPSGVAVNMTGYSVSGKLVNRLNTSALATFATSWIDQAVGKFQLSLPANTTADLSEEGQYDVLLTEPGGDKYYILQGRAFVDPGFAGVP